MIIGGDVPLDSELFPLEYLLESFKRLANLRKDVKLVLAGRRSKADRFSVWNFIEENVLQARVEFRPYFETCSDFPIKKSDCDVWIGRDKQAGDLTTERLLADLDNNSHKADKLALFFTGYHPLRHHGDSTLMRRWLGHLRSAGYRIHLAYYELDPRDATDEMRERARREYDQYLEIPVGSQLVGHMPDGLNIHVDDWCGEEAVRAVADLCARYEYDTTIVVYPFMSAVLEAVPSYTKKILLTVDRFTDRNQRLRSQGYTGPGWVSLSEDGERTACLRADVVVALQDEEAAHFRRLCADRAEVVTISPVLAPAPGDRAGRAPRQGKVRIGYCGSNNGANEESLAVYLRGWASIPALADESQIVIAGGVDPNYLCELAPDGEVLLAKAKPRFVGRVDSLQAFFDQCDLVINPDRGGTGIKIKTLEALAAGAPLLATAAATVGIDSPSRFHSAPDGLALARQTAELCADRGLIDVLARESAAAYRDYCARHAGAMERLFGPALEAAAPLRRDPSAAEIVIPDYVARFATDYQIEHFRKFFARVDPGGKTVLEVGSDYHLAVARLFASNGAKSVTGTNIADWKSPEPLPPNVEFKVGDVCKADLPAKAFDIVFGIAILEHLEDLDAFTTAIDRLLRPGGVAYLQGAPLWTGSLGHHIWIYRDPSDGASETLFEFADPQKNPIPDWSHLTLGSAGMKALLASANVSDRDAGRSVEFIYNETGDYTGSCSNFKPASEIIGSLQQRFYTDVRRYHDDRRNPYFDAALARYSESDLRTIGIEVWLRSKAAAVPPEPPRVSVIIPFFNVEAYFEACLQSVLEQDLDDLEIVLVDDDSRDGSRAIAERYAAQDRRVRIVTHVSNKGLGAARNSGVRVAHGDHILFLDSDDVLSGPDVITHLVSAARQSGGPIVVGAAMRLRPDGELEPIDQADARGAANQHGGAVPKVEAFLAGFGLRDTYYLPSRAWGALIDRRFYDQASLDFPPGEHEDLGHTPFLYFLADGVEYVDLPVVNYRVREQSISNEPWSEDRILRYCDLWETIKANLARFELGAYRGAIAVQVVDHLIWRLTLNNAGGLQDRSVAAVVRDIFRDVDQSIFEDKLFDVLDRLRAFSRTYGRRTLAVWDLVQTLPPNLLLDYYRRRAGLPACHAAGQPAPHADASRGGAAPPSEADAAANAARVAEVFATYEAGASERLRNHPAMLTYGDRAIYFWAAKTASLEGAIVDSGCFVGGTTRALAEGLMQNNLVASRQRPVRGRIRVFDLFTVDDDYILDHLQQNFPGRRFQTGGSFLPVFREQVSDFAELLDVRPGDVTRTGYRDLENIEILGVDICKALPVTDFVVRGFFPRLRLNSLVIQQDFIHEFHPHIHLSMLLLEDHLEKFIELDWGGSVAFRCTRPITDETIVSRFGADCAWYADVPANERRLRQLVDDMIFDGNRWIILLTLAMYYLQNGMMAAAAATYREALERFPQFEPHENTRRMLGTI
jgi:glycosyltransferase involved in cell wall biosynthesis/SAM-dependent methyltransferase